MVFPELPSGFFSISVGAGNFYFHSGNFYQPGPSGYVIARPPIGAIIPTLPHGCATVLVYGTLYYQYGEAYYRPVPNGYVVVDRPVPVAEPVILPAMVITTSQTLNMRSGPGTGYSIVYELPYGTSVKVLEAKDGWYFISLEDGSRGWIWANYTSPLVEPFQG